MSGGIQHTSAVSERGIKMKIKRKNVNGSGSTKSETKHEIVKTEGRGSESTPVLGQNGVVAYDKSKAVFGVEREKSPKMKGPHKKDKVKEKGKCSESVSVANGGIPCATATNATNGLDIPNPAVFSQVATTMDQRPCDSGPGRRENMVVDPYEFNAKVEDGIELPLKKMKTEKIDEATSPLPTVHENVDRGTSTCDASTITESDLLGPCEPGTTVVLEGIVWSEQPGALVVNVTWRDKTFVGALLDSTKFEWAPPRFTCESPVSDVETRAPKGRGKRGRGAGTPVSAEKGEGRKLRKGRRGSSTFTAPPSPARSDISTASSGSKRKARGLDPELSAPTDPKTPKRSRSAARGQSDSPKYIECPEPNCMKKYKHHNGLRYHMTNHHGKMDFNIRSVTAMETSDRDEEEDVNATAGKKDNKNESSKDAETLRDHEDNSPIEDDIPLKEIARSAQQERSKAQESSKVEVSKPDTSAKKKDTVVTTPTTASCVSIAPVSHPKSTPPVFHLPGASVACLGTSVPSVMTQPACMTTATVTCASAVSGLPICVTSVPSTMDLVKTEPMAVRADQRSKQKTVTRPIVPAPMPMGSLGSPASVSQSSMSPVSAHGQVSPSLKPIQPKPTILGEMPPNRDPLVGLNNGRTKSKKKKKEPGSTNISSPGTPKQPGRETMAGASKDESPSKCDRPAVIRSIPSPSRIQDAGLRKEPVVNVADIGKFSADLQRTGATSATVISAQVASAKAMEVAGLVSAANTPSTLSSSARMPQSLNAMNQHQVSSALKISTADRKTPVSESALSPAYSDISDANDSGSPQGSPQKKDEGLDSLVKKDLTASSTPPASDVRPFHDGLYSYPYSAPLLYSQNPLGSQMSPGTVKPVPMGKEGNPAVGDKKIQRSEDMRKSAPYMGQMLPAEVKVEDLGDEAKGRKPEAELNPHMFNLQQLQALQLMHHPNYAYQLQNQFAAMRASHMMHRPQGEQEIKAMEGWPPQAVEQGNRNPVLPHPKYHQAMQLVAERERETKMSPSEIQEQNLREKQNENHQILKENIELKSQMEKSQLEHQQFQRMSLFQAQKMAVEQQQKLNKPPPKLQSSELAGVKVSSHSRGMSDVIKVDDGPRDFHRKEMVDSKSKDSHRDLGKAPEVQSKDDKSRLADSVRDMKGKVSSVGLVSSGSAIVSTSAGSAPVVSYANPSHPFMYNYPPHMFASNLYHQYQPSPIHLPYSAAPVDVDKEKGGDPKAKRSEGEGKGIDSEPQSQQFYSGSVHKIHELGEKPLPSAVHTSSPQPLKGSDSVMATTQGGAGGEKGRDYSSPPSSLPPQRHYHTHHHTHVVRALPTFFPQDNYNGILTSQASIAHSYPPK